MTTATRKKLSAAQAVAWATAEVALQQGQAKVKELAAKCAEMRARYEERLEPSTDPKDIDKDVKVGVAGGWQIRLTRFTGGERFSLSAYRKAGGKITAAMEPHIAPGSPQVRVTVRRLKGPTKPGRRRADMSTVDPIAELSRDELEQLLELGSGVEQVLARQELDRRAGAGYQPSLLSPAQRLAASARR